MEEVDENFTNRKKLLMQINSGQLNKLLLHYINEARSFPKDFSRHLMTNDDVDEKISKLSLFFKYSSNSVPPLIVNKNLEKSSNDLLYHIISIDDGSNSLKFNRDEKERNCLKERLKRYNLIPTYHIDLLIIGVNDAIEALSNVLLNKIQREKILSPEMHYIGISSGFLPSDRLCVVIDIVNSFIIYDKFIYHKVNSNYNNYNNYRPTKASYIRYNNICEDDDENNIDNHGQNQLNNKINTFNSYSNSNEINYYDGNPKFNTAKKSCNNRRYFNSAFPIDFRDNYDNDSYVDNRYKNYSRNNKEGDCINLRISKQKCFSPTNGTYYKYEYPKCFKLPISVSIEKKYAKNRNGFLYPFFSKETKYDDGSILIQPYPDE